MIMIFKIFGKFSEIFGSVRKSGDIFTSEDMEKILLGTRMYCHMDSMNGLFSSKTLLPI